MKNENGFIYDVNASPKMEVLSEFAAVVVSDPPVQKVIEGDNPPLVDRFLFMMKRLDSSSPLPVNDNGHVLSIDGDTMTLYANGAEKVEIGTFTFTQEGDYYYEVSEVNNGLEGYSYDDHVYWYKYEVRRDETGKGLTVNRFLVKNGGAEGETTYDENKVSDTVVFTFTNTYQEHADHSAFLVRQRRKAGPDRTAVVAGDGTGRGWRHLHCGWAAHQCTKAHQCQ